MTNEEEVIVTVQERIWSYGLHAWPSNENNFFGLLRRTARTLKRTKYFKFIIRGKFADRVNRKMARIWPKIRIFMLGMR